MDWKFYPIENSSLIWKHGQYPDYSLCQPYVVSEPSGRVSIILYNHHILLSALDEHYFAELICRSEEEKKRLIVEVLVTWTFRFTKLLCQKTLRTHCLNSKASPPPIFYPGEVKSSIRAKKNWNRREMRIICDLSFIAAYSNEWYTQ